MLKPQDILVLLKVAAHAKDDWPTYKQLSESLFISSSEAHAAVARAIEARLVVPGSPPRLQPRALLEFLVHGVPYAFAAHVGAAGRGVPTAHSAPILAERIAADDGDGLVWLNAKGTVRGQSVSPVYDTAPRAAQEDPKLHDLLALVDAIRVGRAREKALARDLLSDRLGV